MKPGANRVGRPKVPVPVGRDLPTEQADLAKWWTIRPGGKPSGRELARRIGVSEGYIRAFLNLTRPANVHQVEQLQRELEQFGYRCPTDHHKAAGKPTQ